MRDLLEAAQRTIECRVSGLGGSLCSVQVQAGTTLSALQAAIEAKTGIAAETQRLFQGLRELAAGEAANIDLDVVCRHAAAEEPGGTLPVVELMLVQQTFVQMLQAMSPEEVLTWLVCEATGEALGNRDVMLAAVSKVPKALRKAAFSLRSNHQFVLEAAARDGLALGGIDQHFLTSREFVRKALAAHHAALGGLIEAGYRPDDEDLLYAVSCFGTALRYAPARDQACRGLVLAAVHQDGLALCFAAPCYWADKEVVLAAVAQGGLAFRFATPELQGDPEVAAAALSQDRRVRRYLPEQLPRDPALRARRQRKL